MEPSSNSAPGSPRPEDIKAIPVRHPGRWVTVAILAVLVAMGVHAAVFAKVQRGNSSDGRLQWDIVGKYLFTHVIFEGLKVTIELTVIAMVIGVVGGVLLAVMRLSDNPILSGISWVYLWFFRGTPVLVQLYFWYNISYIFPPTTNGTHKTLSVGVPFGPEFIHFDPNKLITSFVAASIGLGLNEAAYMAEIVRAGLLSVDYGQTEAGQSLGMSRFLIMRRVVLPQAMRVIIPPTGNETISMLKTSSLASAITVGEVLLAAQNIYARTYQTIPLLTVASIWYLIVTSVLMTGQYYVERYYARGRVRELPPTPWQRIKGLVITRHALPPAAVDLEAVTGVGLLGGPSKR
ncbi:amino acid ABC transporter permease [Jatrophihabitans sp.]|uniref:amino acid ABC transporter permease n=1 Tax=Jatrophihabitans sp. TaxID=1932789 RepID=UPI0030C70160|nr:transporter permease [Jatrophihabitans sp.]